MVQKHQAAAGPGTEPKKRRRVGFSPADTGVEANECIKIYLVSSKEEVDSPDISCVKPVDLNDFFDGDGKIYGYQGLKINVWINSISLHSYADITYQSSTNGDKGITDLKTALQNIFAETIVDSKDEFLQTFSTERDFIRNMVSNGEVMQSGATDGSSNIAEVVPSDLQVLRMEIGSPNAGLLYSRLVPLVLLFVDGSNPIDVTDPDWHLYLLIQKKEEKENPLYRIVGFTAIYKFYRYPDRLRMRLSQILVLPSFQGKGLGSYLMEVVNNVAVTENVYDLTVEEPSEKFQHIRTCIDINRLCSFDPIKPSIDSAVQTLTKGKLSKKAQIPCFTPPLDAIEKVRESLKINKKHFLKCWEILIYLALDPIDKYMEDYTSVITNHVRTDILGKDIETPKKLVVDVPSSYEPEASFVVFKSLNGEEANSNVQVDENKPDQEQQLKQLVEERIREIKLVAEKVSKICPKGPLDDDPVPMEIDPPSALQVVVRNLEEKQFSPIGEQLIESIYGREVLVRVRTWPATRDGYFLSCEGLVESLAWRTAFSRAQLCDNSWRQNFGAIRNQRDHLLCWDYASTDLVSDAKIRGGWEDEYHALSAWHLCMVCCPDLLGTERVEEVNHRCYSYSMYLALKYMQRHGLPPRETNPEFNCCVIPIRRPEFIGLIDSVLQLDSLEEALRYLPTRPIGADLIEFSNLFVKTNAVYYGPLAEKVSFCNYHAVIIESVEEYRGDFVAVCRMSNGTAVGDKGYVYVSLTTMYLVVDAKSTKVRPTPKPQRLLSNFVVLNMREKSETHVIPTTSSKSVSSSKSEEKEEAKPEYFNRSPSASSSQPQLRPQEAEPEYFKEKLNLEDLWRAAFPVRTEDALYEFKWDFKNVEEALEEGGKLHGKKVYVFGCTESHVVPYKNENKTVIVPTVVCIESTIPPSDKIGVASVQGEVEEIIPMTDMKMDWLPYIPLEKRDRQVDKMNFQIFILGCTQRRSALKLLKEDYVRKFNYCLPYIDNPFKEDESEQSTVVQIMFPSKPPVVCEYDWAIDNLEELTDDLIKKETLLMDQKDEFYEFVKGKSDKAKTAYEEVKQAREKAKEGMGEETKEAYKEMKLYKFYPLPSPDTPDVAGIDKSSFINKYLGKAHEVF